MATGKFGFPSLPAFFCLLYSMKQRAFLSLARLRVFVCAFQTANSCLSHPYRMASRRTTRHWGIPGPRFVQHCARRRGTRRAPNCAIVITGSHVCVFLCALVHEWCRTLVGRRVRVHRCPFRQTKYPVSGSSVVHLLYGALSTWADGERQG
jgi:hypothetical protein